MKASIARFSTLYLLYISLYLTFCSGCKKFVTIDPPKTQIVTASVFSNDATAQAAVSGIYSQMIGGFGFASGNATSFSLLGGLSSDEFTNYSANAEQANFYSNTLDAYNSLLYNYLWQPAYQYIYFANSVLEGLSGSSQVSDSVRKELTGEAKFIRAFCHFYLVNLFGDVPLILTTDYRNNDVSGRTPKEQVYQQIITDLIDAQSVLPSDFSFSNGERVRPNKYAACAMLARVYLYHNDWANAESMAGLIINNPNYNLETDLNSVFLKNSSEAIWQLMPVVPGNNTYEGQNFILTSTPNSVALSQQLLNAFETGDNRRINWVKSITIGTNTFYYPFKYKIKATGQPLVEYSMVLRLSEQYLIRSEARAQLNNVAGAQADLNIVRNRAGLPNTIALAQSSIIDAVIHERQIELFSEWGHRWLDLKRTNRADFELNPIKSPNWQSTDVLYPIPQPEINLDQNIIQNPGY